MTSIKVFISKNNTPVYHNYVGLTDRKRIVHIKA